MSHHQLLKGIAVICLSFGPTLEANGQVALPLDAPSFSGSIHDNESNRDRQGSGLNPLVWKPLPKRNLFRNDAVGINFEHIFNGSKAQRDISMFTPRQDACGLKLIGPHRFELHWPAEKSQWGMEARMKYDFSNQDQIDLAFDCTPKSDLYSQGFAAMMWASYMQSALDRRIHFWGRSDDGTGWVSFGEEDQQNIELGTISHINSENLPHEPGAQTLNLSTNSTKKFIAPFFYGVLDGDQNYETSHDRLLFLVLFDQTHSIRFAMWNFIQNEQGIPDTHSPAWDWHYVIRNPQIGKRYRYRARIVVKPFRGIQQVTDEYRKWRTELGKDLPIIPAE